MVKVITWRIYPWRITKYHRSNLLNCTWNWTPKTQLVLLNLKSITSAGKSRSMSIFPPSCTDLALYYIGEEWEFNQDGSKNPAVHDLYLSLILLEPDESSNSPALALGRASVTCSAAGPSELRGQWRPNNVGLTVCTVLKEPPCCSWIQIRVVPIRCYLPDIQHLVFEITQVN